MKPTIRPLLGCVYKVGMKNYEVWSLRKSLPVISHHQHISNQRPHISSKQTYTSEIKGQNADLHKNQHASVWGDSFFYHYRYHHRPVFLHGNNPLISTYFHSSYHLPRDLPPVPPHIYVRKPTRTVHGEILNDEFEWMQDSEYRENFDKYVMEENRFAEKFLEDHPFRRQMVSEMCHIDGRYKYNDSFTIKHDNFVYSRVFQEDGSLLYLKRAVADSEDRTVCILSVSELLKHYNYPPESIVSDLKVSPCDQYAACMVGTDNDETYTTHVMRMTREGVVEYVDVLPGVIRFEFGNNMTMFYTTPTSNECLRGAQVWRYQIGQKICQDNLIYQEHDNRFFVDLYPTQDGRYINIICSTMQTMTEVHLIDTHNPDVSITLVWPRQDALEYVVEHRDNCLYILANGGDGWQVYRVPVESLPCQPTLRIRKPIFNTSFEKVAGFEVVGDYCIVSVIEPDGIKLAVQSLKEPWNSHYERKISNQFCNIVHTSNSDPSSDQFDFALSSPIHPPVYYSYTLHTSTLSVLQNQHHIADVSREQFSCVRMMCRSKDGTHVPITLFHRHDLTLDGSNSLLVNVYGAYGTDVEMEYSPEKIMLLERGWIVAYCHVRGGGELGRNWYDEGRQLNKHRTIEDFESCITHLHNNSYSKPTLTAAYGISAGGLTVAALCNNSPHLIKAAILKAPFVDVLTTMLDPSIDLTIQDYDEYGDPTNDPAIYDAIKGYCPYYNIHDKQSYPSIYVITAQTDRRVPSWGPVKYAAKLRSMQRCPQLLLQVDQDGGHFGSAAADTEDTIAQAAKEWMFLYKVLNLPRK